MITELIKPLETDIEALGWLERYGGVVRVANRFVDDGKGGFYASFPVSCNVSDTDCWDRDMYKDLIPDDSKTGIAYFEEVGGLTWERETDAARRTSQKRPLVRLEGIVRFVVWVNGPLVGHQSCNLRPLLLGDVLRIFSKSFRNVDAGIITPIGRLGFDLLEIEPRDPSPFARWGYEHEKVVLYPYDYLSVLVRVTAVFNADCMDEVVIGSPVCP
jgi:hypothetical protein